MQTIACEVPLSVTNVRMVRHYNFNVLKTFWYLKIVSHNINDSIMLTSVRMVTGTLCPFFFEDDNYYFFNISNHHLTVPHGSKDSL